MDLRQLRYFIGIVEAGSLSRAADKLHVAQSAISHHLANLEAEVGRQLVLRGPRGIALTEAGAVLYRHAEAILRSIESARRDVMSELDVPAGRVAVGFPSILAPILSCELLTRVRKAYPQILLHVSDGNSWMVRDKLISGRLDVAVLYESQSERGIVVEPLLQEELFYVTADPDTSPIRVADAAQRPLLLPGPNSSSWHVAQEAFKKHGLTAAPAAEIDALGTLCRAIASGIGNSILPWCAVYDAEWKTEVHYRRVADATLVRPIALCFSDVVQRTPAVETVADVLKALIHERVESGTWQGVSLIEPTAIALPDPSLSP